MLSVSRWCSLDNLRAPSSFLLCVCACVCVCAIGCMKKPEKFREPSWERTDASAQGPRRTGHGRVGGRGPAPTIDAANRKWERHCSWTSVSGCLIFLSASSLFPSSSSSTSEIQFLINCKRFAFPAEEHVNCWSRAKSVMVNAERNKHRNSWGL